MLGVRRSVKDACFACGICGLSAERVAEREVVVAAVAARGKMLWC